MAERSLDQIIEDRDCKAVRNLSDEDIKRLLDFADNGKEIGEKDAALVLGAEMDLRLLLPNQNKDEEALENAVVVSVLALALKEKPELLDPLFALCEEDKPDSVSSS